MKEPGARSGRRIRWQPVILGSLIAAFTAGVPAIPALAAARPAGQATPSAAQCNTTVIDATSRHVLRSDAPVLKELNSLEAKGADVRVRIFNTAPGGSLDAYEDSQIADCRSWRLSGTIKPNLLVLLVSLDHQDAVFYGTNYSRMQGQVDQIRADMGGDFRSGNFTAGIAKGEQETYSALWPSGLPEWAWLCIIIGGCLVLGIVCSALGGTGRRYGGAPYVGGYGIGGYGGGGGAGGGAGGSSGSW